MLDRLVTPVVDGVYGVHPDEARIDDLLPTLNREMTRGGSLSLAVQHIRDAAPPGSAVGGVDGGVHVFVTALADAVALYGGELHLQRPVQRVLPDGDGWVVHVDGGQLEAERVLVAVDGAAAWALLESHLPALRDAPRPAPKDSHISSLLLDDERLDTAPRGTGLLVAPERADARLTAVTHASAKWPWLAAQLPAHRHIVRTFAREPRSDEELLGELGTLLGFRPAHLIERVDTHWRDTAPALDPATRTRRAIADAALAPATAGAAGLGGLAATGSWLSGTGLASVVAHAERTAAALLATP